LILDEDEKKQWIEQDARIGKFIRPLLGSLEFINSKERYCIWIKDSQITEALKIPFINDRVSKCKKTRAESKRAATNELAEKPWAFGEVRHKDSNSIIIPRVSSESRQYIPMGFLDPGIVVSDSAFAIYDAPIWLFGLLTSRIHMVWVRTVGGKLKTDYRYSAGLCYNPYPFPKLSPTQKAAIEDAATDILITREPYLTMGKTLADLYDPEKMPADLKQAHERLDDIVESCYPGYPFSSDEARLECLFKLYEKMTNK
jgi:hypothetical protein